MIGEICFGLGLVVLAALGIVKIRPKQAQLPAAKDPVFENFFLSLSIDADEWEPSSESVIPWFRHKSANIRFTLSPGEWADSKIHLPPSIHTVPGRQILHEFSREEINRIQQLMKETQINKLFDKSNL